MKTNEQMTLCPIKKVTFLHNGTTLSCRSARVLLKPSAFLSLFDRWGTNPSLQNEETRDAGGDTRYRRPERGCLCGSLLLNLPIKKRTNRLMFNITDEASLICLEI
jgi:hypothetical protein